MDRRGFLAASGTFLAGCSIGTDGSSDDGFVPPDGSSAVDTAPPASSSEIPPAEVAPASRPHLAGAHPPPFSLGVASGDPSPDGVTLWTRLADANGGAVSGDDVEVGWIIATDPSLGDVVASGTTTARAAEGHTARVTLNGLPAGHLYYRFALSGVASATGRTSTTTTGHTGPYRIGLLSCQHYEEGHFAALRALVDEQPDLVIHVGDYVYERGASGTAVRTQGVYDPTDLAGYRQLYDTYRRDAHLQTLHAAAPMVSVWDDHEVRDNDAGTRPDPRRAAAYRAWWEFQAAAITEPDAQGGLRIHRQLVVPGLARIWLLDGRQHRDDQACDRLEELPAFDRCDAVEDPARTMLGLDQEAWLHGGFADDGSWDLVAQQTVMADMSLSLGGVTGINHDQWDGYVAARRRLLTAAVRNPRSVVLSGDLHAAMVNVVKDGELEIPELVAPSVTTRMSETLAAGLSLAMSLRSTVRAFEPDVHGYLLLDVAPGRIGATLRDVPTSSPDAVASTVGQWEITPSSRKPQQV